ncbi:MAG: hypothetical protein CSA51_03265 [Gammaproteobacteria bacterium]|nr:MAG: hypothetical protein CSA51_03265 [Gammaproteobacteria bacterium]
MKIEYDPTKETKNLEKHKVSLTWASSLEWEELLAIQDCRADYGEVRMIGYAPISNRLYCVVYTDRGDVRRIISLRKANKREVLSYAKQQNRS